MGGCGHGTGDMNPRKGLYSLKITTVILSLILFLLIINVTIPQEQVVGRQTIQDNVKGRPWMAFFLITLGFSHVPTSPLFLFLLGCFFLQLLAFLIRFISTTWKRVRMTPERWEAWRSIDMRDHDGKRLTAELVRKGFREKPLVAGTIWFVRNRISPLGFLLFHVSFFFLLTGGVLIHYTRYHATVELMQNRPVTFAAREWIDIHRKPLLSPPDQVFTVTLDSVEAKKIKDEPIRLDTELTFSLWGGSIVKMASVNCPGDFLGFSFYPQTLFDAYVFKIFNAQDYLVDTFGIQIKGEDVILPPVILMDGFSLLLDPGRDPLARVEGPGFSKTIPLEPGNAVQTPVFTLLVADRVPWVSFQVIYERGGVILITGFMLAITGLIFRFFFPRQDLVLTSGMLYFRGDYFPQHLRENLEELRKDHHDTP